MKRLIGIVVALHLMTWTAVASADVVPPEVWECNNLDAGAPCASGTCQPSTCSRLDYSQGTPPVGTVQYACLKCVNVPVNGSAGAGGGTAVADAGEDPDAGNETGIPGSCSCTMVGRAQQEGQTQGQTQGLGLGLLLGFGLMLMLRRGHGRPIQR